MSVRLDRLQRGLFLALAGVSLGGAATDVVWVRNQQPRATAPERNLISLSLTSGPVPVRRPLAGRTQTATAIIDLTVTAATPGVLSIARLNDFDYRHEAIGGDTLMSIRDDLLAQIREGEAGAVDAAPRGNDSIRLTAALAGGLRSLSVLGSLATSGKVPGGDIMIKEGSTSSLVTMQAFTRGNEPRHSATALLDLAVDELRSEDGLALLDRHGVALWDEGAPTDISAIAGATWESRASRDLTVAAQGVSVRAVGVITRTSMTVNVGLVPGGEPIESFTASADAPT